MASNMLVVIFVATVVLAAPAPALAADLLVEDSHGWRLDNFDYDNWVDEHNFIVGDTLVSSSRYARDRRSVVQATAARFAASSTISSPPTPAQSGGDATGLASAQAGGLAAAGLAAATSVAAMAALFVLGNALIQPSAVVVHAHCAV